MMASTTSSLVAAIRSGVFGIWGEVRRPDGSVIRSCGHQHRTVGPAEDCARRMLRETREEASLRKVLGGLVLG